MRLKEVELKSEEMKARMDVLKMRIELKMMIQRFLASPVIECLKNSRETF